MSTATLSVAEQLKALLAQATPAEKLYFAQLSKDQAAEAKAAGVMQLIADIRAGFKALDADPLAYGVTLPEEADLTKLGKSKGDDKDKKVSLAKYSYVMTKDFTNAKGKLVGKQGETMYWKGLGAPKWASAEGLTVMNGKVESIDKSKLHEMTETEQRAWAQAEGIEFPEPAVK